MSFLGRLFSRPETRADVSASVSRSSNDVSFASALLGGGGIGGVTVREAEGVGVVNACISVVASSIASLDACVYNVTPAGRFESPDHPVASLIRSPNPAQTWSDWLEFMVGSLLLHGNAVAEIIYDGAGRPIQLSPIPYQFITPMLAPSGALIFEVQPFTVMFGASAQTRRILASDTVYIKERSENGLTGVSRIARSPGVIRNSIDQDIYFSNLMRNGAKPSGIVEVPKRMSDDAWERFKTSIRQNSSGLNKSSGTMFLEEGATFKSMSWNAEQSQVLQSRQFSVQQICQLLGVPGQMVNDLSDSSYNTSESAFRFFSVNTLRPIVAKIQQEFKRAVFGVNSTFELDLDLSTLMDGDWAAKWAAFSLAVTDGILSANEARTAMGFNPRPENAVQPESVSGV